MGIMVNPGATATQFSARAALARTVAFGAAGAAIAGAHLLFGIGLPCPFLALTGWQCPFCGGTRAAGALATGDLTAAWAHNAFIVVGAAVLGLCLIAWTGEVLGGPALRPPKALRPLTQQKIYLVVGMVAVVFAVVRNLV